jgi:hypothetical protein
MEVIEGRTIENEYVDIDNKQFKSCTLSNCLLRYSGDPVIFEQSQFRGCRYVFFGHARATVHFLQAVGLVSPSTDWGEYPDGVK